MTPKKEQNTGTELPKVDNTAPSSSASVERIRISPVARRIARKHGVTIESVSGTGHGRTIIREDIEEFNNDKYKQQYISDLFYGRT